MKERTRGKEGVVRFNKFHTSNGNKDALKKIRKKNPSEFRHSRDTETHTYVISIYYI